MPRLYAGLFLFLSSVMVFSLACALDESPRADAPTLVTESTLVLGPTETHGGTAVPVPADTPAAADTSDAVEPTETARTAENRTPAPGTGGTATPVPRQPTATPRPQITNASVETDRQVLTNIFNTTRGRGVGRQRHMGQRETLRGLEGRGNGP